MLIHPQIGTGFQGSLGGLFEAVGDPKVYEVIRKGGISISGFPGNSLGLQVGNALGPFPSNRYGNIQIDAEIVLHIGNSRFHR